MLAPVANFGKMRAEEESVASFVSFSSVEEC